MNNETLMYAAVRVLTIGDGQTVVTVLELFKHVEDAQTKVLKIQRDLMAASHGRIEGTPVKVEDVLRKLGVTNIQHAVAEMPLGSVIETAGVRLVV